MSYQSTETMLKIALETKVMYCGSDAYTYYKSEPYENQYLAEEQRWIKDNDITLVEIPTLERWDVLAIRNEVGHK